MSGDIMAGAQVVFLEGVLRALAAGTSSLTAAEWWDAYRSWAAVGGVEVEE
jgi:hypothetical protein